MSEWIDFSADWEPITEIARRWHENKGGSSAQRNYVKKYNTDFYGILGEYVVGMTMNWPVDFSVLPGSDSGWDFCIDGVTYDVKASHWEHPSLLEYPDKELAADIYILVHLDMDDRRGRIIGWASTEQLRSARLKDHGHGVRLSIPYRQIVMWGQNTLPRDREKSVTKYSICQ